MSTDLQSAGGRFAGIGLSGIAGHSGAAAHPGIAAWPSVAECYANAVRRVLLAIAFALLVLGESEWLIDNGRESLFLYAGDALLLAVTGISLWRRVREITAERAVLFALVLVLFCTGILMQPLAAAVKLRLVFTMLALEAFALASWAAFDGYGDIRAASYGIVCGIVLVMLLSLAVGEPLLISGKDTAEGTLGVSFTGGIKYKNYFASTAMAAMFGLVMHGYAQGARKVDLAMLAVLFVGLVASNSRGAWIIFLVFAAVLLARECVGRLRDSARALAVLVGIAALLCAVAAAIMLVNGSQNYQYRVNGVVNYLDYCAGDPHRLAFGSADIAYGSDEDYVMAIRHEVGMSGTYEMGFINTLIKNGLLGIAGYAVVFALFFIGAVRQRDRKRRWLAFAVLAALLVSSLVESYVCNIHVVFGVFCYVALSWLCLGSRCVQAGSVHRKRVERNGSR